MPTVCYDVYYADGAENGSCLVDSMKIDGEDYVVYKDNKFGPTILDNTNRNFAQYFSVRKTPIKCGTIPISRHFDTWANLGMPLGKMYEAKLLVQTGGGTGFIDYTYATITAEKDPTVVQPKEDDPSTGSWYGRVWMSVVMLWVVLFMFW